MARQQAEARERGGDERLPRSVPAGLLLLFAPALPPAPAAAAEVPEPRPQGSGQALDVKGGVGVDHKDGLAAGQGVSRGLWKRFSRESSLD